MDAPAPRKGVAALIVSKMKGRDPDGPESNEGDDDDDSYEGKMACAEDMMRAIEEKDAETFLKALDSYLAHR